jgi:hypothetical protein
MFIDSPGSSLGFTCLITLCLLAFLGCKGSERECGSPGSPDLLSKKGIDPKRLASLHCAYFFWSNSRSTWLSDEESNEARALLLSMLSQKDAESEAAHQMGEGLYIVNFSLSQRLDEMMMPEDSLVRIMTPIRPNGAYEIRARSTPSEEFEAIKIVLPDERAHKRLLSLLEKAAARRDCEEARMKMSPKQEPEKERNRSE